MQVVKRRKSITTLYKTWDGVKGLVVMLMVVGGLIGCVGPAAHGDRAMEMGNHQLALEHYEKAMAEGSRDSQMYFRAAKASQHLGKFAQAERYYSQSLRYGGGTDVAHALADFYIQTSNFTQAARILQYLMRFEEDVQPLYTNVGVALMYGGKYLDAEAYLLLAQQMDPDDPMPYINLGVLYDRHIRNPPKAVRFFECFTQIQGESADRRTVVRRLQEIENQGAVDTSRVNLKCGEAYRVQEAERHDLKRVFDLYEEGGFEEGENGGPVVIERMESRARSSLVEVEGEEDSEPSIQPAEEEEEEAVDYHQTRREAADAFDDGRFDQAVSLLTQIPQEERDLQDRAFLAQAYYNIGKFEDAASQWELVLERRPTPEIAARLIAIYARLDAGAEKQRVCERFAGWPDYEEALQACER